MKNDESDEIGDPDPLFQGRFTIDERFDFQIRRETKVLGTPASHAQTIADVAATKPFTDASPANSTASDDDPLIGRTIGNFEILECLGHGGFGNVYKAEDNKLDRMVALKFLRFPLDKEYRKLFVREAKVLANLGPHSSIVQIYTWGEYEGSYYFALEYLDANADSLRDNAESRVSVRRALQVVVECASALDYAHERGILHRDVKPANILIDSKSQRAKLCDFGLARFQQIGAAAGTMQLAGSPPYMAPEQIMGSDLDARTDVYGLGVSLYELLSGRLPFEADSQAAVFDRIRKGKDTPLSTHRPDLSPALLGLVRKATAWNPKDRFQSAREMQKAAQRILDELDSSGGSSSTSKELRFPRRWNWNRVGFAATIAILLVIAVALGIRERQPNTRDMSLAGAPGIAEAMELLSASRVEEAEARLRPYIVAHPDDGDAHYALGYARLLARDIDAAAQEFALVKDTGRRAEGLAVVANARRSQDATQLLGASLAAGGPPYPAILLASAEFTDGHVTEALDRLKTVDPKKLYFDWQRHELNRLFGQAHMKTGDFAAARGFLITLPDDDPIGHALLQTAARLETERAHAAVQEQIERISARVPSPGEESELDQWTSRPLRIRIEPTTATGGGLATSNGLVDALPELLAIAFEQQGGRALDVVDREFIGSTLFEQELSSISSGKDAIAVGKLRGARVMIQTEFAQLGGREYLRLKMIDTETTDVVPLEQIPVDFGTDIGAWISNAAERAKNALVEAYPLQGILTSTQGELSLNIGRALGVGTGTKFQVFPRANSGAPLESVTATAIDPVDLDSAGVELSGATREAVPAEGWFLREVSR